MTQTGLQPAGLLSQSSSARLCLPMAWRSTAAARQSEIVQSTACNSPSRSAWVATDWHIGSMTGCLSIPVRTPARLRPGAPSPPYGSPARPCLTSQGMQRLFEAEQAAGVTSARRCLTALDRHCFCGTVLGTREASAQLEAEQEHLSQALVDGLQRGGLCCLGPHGLLRQRRFLRLQPRHL